MNKKIITLILLITTCVVLLSSCSWGCNKMLISDNSENIADARLEQIINATSNGEKDTLKAMFSKKALNDAKDFNNSMEYLINLFQGKVISWNRDRFSSDGDIENGKKSTRLWSWYTVKTDIDTYLFLVIDYTVDTINPDNAGLYTLRVVREEDKDTQFSGYWEDMVIAGIYMPDK